jgi:hypothetical protein
MNRRQRTTVIQFVTVVSVTAAAVAAMVSFKDWVNRSEAVRAMEHLGTIVVQYRKEHGSVPPESYIDNIKESLEGHVRLGNLQYRGLWIDFESTPDEVLGYTYKNYRSLLLDEGYVVLRLDGTVEWLGIGEFEAMLARQQSREEVEMLQRR